MVIVGIGGDRTEIIDVSNPMKSCALNDISGSGQPYRYRSTGGMLGMTPVICGGKVLWFESKYILEYGSV